MSRSAFKSSRKRPSGRGVDPPRARQGEKPRRCVGHPAVMTPSCGAFASTVGAAPHPHARPNEARPPALSARRPNGTMMPGSVLNPGGRPGNAIEELRAKYLPRVDELMEELVKLRPRPLLRATPPEAHRQNIRRDIFFFFLTRSPTSALGDPSRVSKPFKPTWRT